MSVTTLVISGLPFIEGACAVVGAWTAGAAGVTVDVALGRPLSDFEEADTVDGLGPDRDEVELEPPPPRMMPEVLPGNIPALPAHSLH